MASWAAAAQPGFPATGQPLGMTHRPVSREVTRSTSVAASPRHGRAANCCLAFGGLRVLVVALAVLDAARRGARCVFFTTRSIRQGRGEGKTRRARATPAARTT